MNTATSEAGAKQAREFEPLAMRQLLDLKPGHTDAVSMVLWRAIYGSRSLADFENSVQESIDQLTKALAIVRGQP